MYFARAALASQKELWFWIWLCVLSPRFLWLNNEAFGLMSYKVLFQVQASRTLVYKDSSQLLSSIEQGVSHVLRTPMWAGIFLSSSDKNLLLHEGFSLVFDLLALQACQCLWLGSHLAKGNSHFAFLSANSHALQRLSQGLLMRGMAQCEL